MELLLHSIIGEYSHIQHHFPQYSSTPLLENSISMNSNVPFNLMRFAPANEPSSEQIGKSNTTKITCKVLPFNALLNRDSMISPIFFFLKAIELLKLMNGPSTKFVKSEMH